MKTITLLCALGLFVLPTSSQVLQVPPQDPFYSSGKQLATPLSAMTREAREEEIYNQIMLGNVPEFERALVPVSYSAGGHTVTIFVTPDYLALGTNTDYFLMPMSPILAQRVANATHCTLPTKLMVDKIYLASALKLRPQPIPPTAEMITVPVFAQHNDSVWALRQPMLPLDPQGTLIGGTKKDVIISNKIYNDLKSTTPHPVVIYGWHQLNGLPIQPVYNGHVDWYADYSHGIRLVLDSAVVDGNTVSIRSALTDASLAGAFSDEGTIAVPYYAVPTGIEDAKEGKPEGFELFQNFPNPFNPSTTITFSVPHSELVVLDIYDSLGRRVERLLARELSAGLHSVRWENPGSSGLYVARLQTGDGLVLSRTLIALK